MRSRIIAYAGVIVALIPLSVHAGFTVAVTSVAQGNIPTHQEDNRRSASLADWTSAGFVATTHAHADRDAFDSPSDGADATAVFDQANPTDAVLRSKVVARRFYGGRYQNIVWAQSIFSLNYGLQIENLTGSPVDVNFAGEMHGLFATPVRDFAHVQAEEKVHLTGLTKTGSDRGSLFVDYDGAKSDGLWSSFVHPAKVHDDIYGTIDGFELNSFEYYGSRLVAGGATVFSDVDYDLMLTADLDIGNGLALVDFTNTGHLIVTATDPFTGANRDSDIRVTLVPIVPSGSVPEPIGLIPLLLGALALTRRHHANRVQQCKGHSVGRRRMLSRIGFPKCFRN